MVKFRQDLAKVGKNIGKTARDLAGAPKGIFDALRTTGRRIAGNDRPIPGYKRGGKVKKTGLAKVHKGERVLTKKQAKKFKFKGKTVFGK